MKVTEIVKVENCIESRNVWDLYFDTDINKNFIDYWAERGKLIYDDSFEKPFFKIMVRAQYTIKGVEHTNTFRVILPMDDGQDKLDLIKNIVENYK